MSVTIRFPDGREATLVDEDGTWTCKDQRFADTLRSETDDFLDERYRYFPRPMEDLAKAMAARLGATVVEKASSAQP